MINEIKDYFKQIKKGGPNPVVDHHTASYPYWILNADMSQLPAKAVDWGSPMGSYRPRT